jgi:retron-type reverse transcriptase
MATSQSESGSARVDGKSIEAIVSAQQEAEMIQSLQQKLRTKTYHFQPVRRVDIPKPKGGVRPLGIATVEDPILFG